MWDSHNFLSEDFYNQKKVERFLINQDLNLAATFAECMRICQEDEKEKCLSVTFFPSHRKGARKFYGVDNNGNERFNCYLHDKRCHEGMSLKIKI